MPAIHSLLQAASGLWSKLALSNDPEAVIEDACSNTTFSGCGKCSSCHRRREASVLIHLTTNAAKSLRSHRQIQQPGCYNSDTLPEMFIHNFENHSSQVQEEALSRWKEWARKNVSLSPAEAFQQPREIRKVKEILDDFFFRGALGPYIQLSLLGLDRVGQTGSFAWNDTPRVEIQCKPSANLGSKWCLVRKFPLERSLTQTDNVGILSIVLRELGAASLAVFGCQSCRKCDNAGLERLCQAMEKTANEHFDELGTWHLR